MGPSAKFVSAIIDAIFKKNGGKFFFSEKRPYPGVGVWGGFGKRPYFPRIFFNPSLMSLQYTAVQPNIDYMKAKLQILAQDIVLEAKG